MVQVFFDSTDGARIPMFIVRKKGAAGAAGVGAGEGKDAAAAPAPTLMYGYGGFNISITPSFSAMRIGWLHHFSGVLAVVNLRGGGEYGEEWHKDGSLHKKQHVFDDFIGAGEELVRQGIMLD